MNLRVPKMRGISWLAAEPVSFSRRTLLHGLSKYIGLQVKYPLFLLDFNEICTFSRDFGTTIKYQVLWKSVKWRPSFPTRTERRTDVTKLIVALRNFDESGWKDLLLRLYPGNFKSGFKFKFWCSFHILSSILSDDRSKASSKTIPPHSSIQSFLLQMKVPSPVLKVIQ